jgi:hypothetical protein
MKPKEDPALKAQRERDQRTAQLRRDQASMQQASGLTSDLNAIYGLSLFSKGLK